MDCLRSFSIDLIAVKNYNTAGTNVKTWGVIGNQHWVVADVGSSSVFNVEGFKRLDIYGIEMVGSVISRPSISNACIVQDYSFQISLNAQVPLASGNIAASPNYWPISKNVTSFDLSKYTNQITFESPYAGCSAISFENFNAQGNQAEAPNSIGLDIQLTFVFYYKYDGE